MRTALPAALLKNKFLEAPIKKSTGNSLLAMPIKSAPPSLRVTSGDGLRPLLTGASIGIFRSPDVKARKTPLRLSQ
jgi:hypothetical protein